MSKLIINELETFIYKSSHDMRTPITSILGLVDIAMDGLDDIDEALQYCAIIKKQAERLDSILLKLIETMRIRKG